MQSAKQIASLISERTLKKGWIVKKPQANLRFFPKLKYYSSSGAPTGQAPAQAPQEMHASASIT